MVNCLQITADNYLHQFSAHHPVGTWDNFWQSDTWPVFFHRVTVTDVFNENKALLNIVKEVEKDESLASQSAQSLGSGISIFWYSEFSKNYSQVTTSWIQILRESLRVLEDCCEFLIGDASSPYPRHFLYIELWLLLVPPSGTSYTLNFGYY